MGRLWLAKRYFGATLGLVCALAIPAHGMVAVVARSAWFLNGDLQQLTTLGGEFILP
jgi:hypothetical protein